MVTLGQVLAHLNKQAFDGNGDDVALSAVEAIVTAISELGGDLANHITLDGRVVDAPEEG